MWGYILKFLMISCFLFLNIRVHVCQRAHLGQAHSDTSSDNGPSNMTEIELPGNPALLRIMVPFAFFCNSLIFSHFTCFLGQRGIFSLEFLHPVSRSSKYIEISLGQRHTVLWKEVLLDHRKGASSLSEWGLTFLNMQAGMLPELRCASIWGREGISVDVGPISIM